MMQSRADSLMESLTNIFVGLAVSFVANLVILPFFLGVSISVGTNLAIGAAYTVVSLVRSYALRRAFNGRSVWLTIKHKLGLPWHRCFECKRLMSDEEYFVNWGSCGHCFDRHLRRYEARGPTRGL